ncbi:hypothetical protein M3Y94_00012500 [Aphelenchoides besseyi]|nr:hypothetical protein M3Y94_00012500 [Aphelenchoides besseyi]KAI6216825.1 hypothetical protein M3Y95_01255200 [Aphelenchoides besseyi]
MDGGCEHDRVLEISKEWIISEPRSFWRTRGNVKKTNVFSFEFQPNVKFWIEVHTYGEDWGFFQFCSTDPLVYSEFDFYIWAEQKGKFLGGSDVLPLKFHGGYEFIHGYKPMTLVCEVQYVGDCPYCEIEEDRGIKLPVEKEAEQIEWNEEISNSQMDDLTDENDQPCSTAWKTQMKHCKRKAAAREKENNEAKIQKMSDEDLYNEFRAQFIALPAEQRAIIIQQVEMFKDVSGSG